MADKDLTDAEKAEKLAAARKRVWLLDFATDFWTI
jgi:hypothetical protein